MHWKKRGIFEPGEGEARMPMDFYVAFLRRIQLEGSCQHINAQMLFFFLTVGITWLASRLHIQNVNPEPTHFSPQRAKQKVSLESVTNSCVSVL